MITTLSASQLRKAANIREKIDRLQTQLDGLLGGTATKAPAAKPKKVVGEPTKPAKKRRLSATTRAKMAARAKARWVKAKAAGKSTL